LPDSAADFVDQVVRLDPVARPFGVEYELLALLPWLGDGNEVGALAAPLDDLVGDPSSSKRKCRVGSPNGELRIGFSMTTWRGIGDREGAVVECGPGGPSVYRRPGELETSRAGV
jgi:hypothetical protein